MSWLCALFRFYVRFKIVNSPGWDDLFLAGTVVSIAALTGTGMAHELLMLKGVCSSQ